MITKVTGFSLNFQNELVFSEFNDFAITYVFKTHTNMTLNVNELSSIMMLTLTKFNATIHILFVFGRIMVFVFGQIVKTPIRYSPCIH